MTIRWKFLFPHVKKSEFRSPGNFCLRNPESRIQKCFLVNLESWLSVESGIQIKESGIPLTIGIRNPSSTDKNPESTPWSQESVAWNRQSKTVLDSLIWQSDLILSVVYSRLQDKKYGREVFLYEKGKQIQVDYWSNQERGQPGGTVMSILTTHDL